LQAAQNVGNVFDNLKLNFTISNLCAIWAANKISENLKEILYNNNPHTMMTHNIWELPRSSFRYSFV